MGGDILDQFSPLVDVGPHLFDALDILLSVHQHGFLPPLQFADRL
jgi:hypothetical protein